MNGRILAIIAIVCGLGSAGAWPRRADAASTLTVTGTSDIWAAGLANASTLNLTSGSGVTPPGVAFSAAAGHTLTFSSITGSVSSGGSPAQYSGAAGYTVFNGTNASTNLAPVGSISGLTSGNTGFFLVGVFTTGGVPSGPAPSSLDFSSPINFTTETPLIDQIFYVGAGTNALGVSLNILVPSNATNLYLGFADGADPSRGYLAWNGQNGFYSDNAGSLSVTFSFAVPEPSSLAMVGPGLVGLLSIHRRVRDGRKPGR